METKKVKVERKRLVTRKAWETVEIDVQFSTHIIYLKPNSGCGRYKKIRCAMSDENGLKVDDHLLLNYSEEDNRDVVDCTIVKIVKLDNISCVDEIDGWDIPEN